MLLSWFLRSRARTRKPNLRSPTACLSFEQLEDRTVPSTFTVLNLADSGDGSLRAAIHSADLSPGADEIQFAPEVRGTIALTTGELVISSDLTITSPGASLLTVSGSGASRVFRVLGGADAASAITVGILDLTVAHGRATEGGGVMNSGFSDLTLGRVVLSDNLAVGTPGTDARGGGASVTGAGSTLHVVDSLVVGNTADGRVNATRGSGGGLSSSQGGHLDVARTTVADNRALGGRTNISGAGGGITVALNATATVTGSVIRDNRAIGATGGGPGHGGGILVTGGLGGVSPSSLVVTHSVLTRNEALGGNGGLGQGQAWGGAIDVRLGARAAVSDSDLTENRTIAGSGGRNSANDNLTSTALGGAISCGALSPGAMSFLEVSRSTLRGNQAIGGNNGTHTAPNIADVGSAHGGAIYTTGGSETMIRDSAILQNKAVGGNGNTGTAPAGFVGAATGGGINNSLALLVSDGPSRPARLTVINSTLTGNEVIGGTGNTGSGARVFVSAGLGGVVANYLGGTTEITGSRLTHNRATGGESGLGAGGGVVNALGSFSTTAGVLAPSIVNVTNSVLEHNKARGGQGTAGSNGSDGWGGAVAALFSATTDLTGSTLANNHAIGGQGGSGGDGGDGHGGGAYNDASSSLTFRNSTVIENHANGGDAGTGGSSGDGIGGGVYNLGLFDFDAFTVVERNHASTSHDDLFA